MVSEKGLCKILKSAYKGAGYQLIPESKAIDGDGNRFRQNMLTVSGATWAVQCPTVELPSEAAVQIVKDAGYLPVEAMLIARGASNQIIMDEVAMARAQLFKDGTGELISAKKIPVIFKERWQLYQTEEGVVFGLDTELLKLIDFKAWDPNCYLTNSGMRAIFIQCDSTIHIAPGRFSREDSEKIQHIAALDWEKQQECEDPVVNISLFDPDEDEPLMEVTE